MNAPSWRRYSGGASRNGFRRPTCWAKPGSAGFPSASTNACWCRARLSPNLSNVNIERHDLGERVYTVQGDGFAGLPGQRFDLIVSNPPYVDAEDFADMPAEFHHEPELGLACGDDGLDLVRRMLAEAADHLSEKGLLIVEVGNSEVHVQALYPEVDFTWLEFEHGGHGVFMLSAAQCREHRELFRSRLEK